MIVMPLYFLSKISMEISLRHFIYKRGGSLRKAAAATDHINTMLRFVILSCLVVCALGGVAKFRRPRYDGRIVGGEDARIEDYPHQLSLRYYGSHICGASIISEYFAMTAAHCTDGSSASALSLKAGSDQMSSGGSVHDVEEIIQNPGFNQQELDYDISLLKVIQPFKYSNTVKPIGLPAAAGPGQDIPDKTAVDVSGWGTLSEGGSLPEQLQHVIVHTVNADECANAYGRITDRMLCAADPGKDSCQGDSGGPLISNGIQYGIVSYGYGCAEAGYPGVYSRVAGLRDWITANSGL
ncbi:hypothetical protein J437_LFUL007409 [Ladona fulva]|uniref:Peptidase S1 domain-containing protein n=1 Tax=Ladona fulva TaxID=123851 RepID=A0A8K0K2F2_LADFU|nr:hypothetical protein J437_LFUL007409 [Ladona fulva]